MTDSKLFFQQQVKQFIKNCLNNDTVPDVVERMTMYTLVFDELTKREKSNVVYEVLLKEYEDACRDFVSRTNMRGEELESYLLKKTAIIEAAFAYMTRLRNIGEPSKKLSSMVSSLCSLDVKK